ncbi:MAG TPA: cysteine desulfurase family protein [Fimbriimonadales bacterium]|nr:cysteine desulfurase family protein [Fimbriimonadales bacterium]
MSSILYFDNAASTKVDPRVLEEMLPYFTETYANPSALHTPAQRAKAAIEESRETIAELLGANDPSEIIFTSGATEGNNTVINIFREGTILISAIEHPSVLNTALETGRCKLIPVDSTGKIDDEVFSRLLEETKPSLVSVMLVNNEIGTIQNIDRLGELTRKAGAYFHTDLTQAVGKMELNLAERPVDYATLSGHKFHAPKGIGALYVRSSAPFTHFMVGGTHENGRRAGTLNAPGIVGLGKAARLVMEEYPKERERFASMKRRIVKAILEKVPDSRLNGSLDESAPHIISISFYRTEGESIIINLDTKGICVTAGAACSSGLQKRSHVLTAIGLPEEWLRGTVRLSLGRFNTEEEAEILIQSLIESVEEVRSLGYVAQ